MISIGLSATLLFWDIDVAPSFAMVFREVKLSLYWLSVVSINYRFVFGFV
jgi:hypothetical protein